MGKTGLYHVSATVSAMIADNKVLSKLECLATTTNAKNQQI